MNNSNNKKKIIKKGTVLFNGVSLNHDKCPPKYKYQESNNYSTYVLYTATDINSAKGYASSCVSEKLGYIRVYIVKKDIELSDISDNQLHYNVNNVKNIYCKNGGYYLNWGNKAEEIVLCDPEKKLEYIGAYKCQGKQKEENELTCKCPNVVGGNKKKDKRFGKYKHGNHTHRSKSALKKCKKN